jgi:molybdopterin synthase catalytic subunit
MTASPAIAPARSARASAIHDGPLPRSLCHAATLSGPAQGAVAAYLGVVRTRNPEREPGVTRLVYQCHRPMAERLLARLIDEAAERFDRALSALVVHGTGLMRPGDIALCIQVSCANHADALAACRHLLERIRQDLPVWAHEHYDDGTSCWRTGA